LHGATIAGQGVNAEWPTTRTRREYAPQHREVYHDHENCHDGKNIKREHRIDGTGGKKRCKECVRLG
jgi:hypothetical protein